MLTRKWITIRKELVLWIRERFLNFIMTLIPIRSLHPSICFCRIWIIVAGKNFGCGSSREQAPGVLKALGVKAVIAKSFARIFFRNAINIGLPAIVCKDLPDAVKTGDTLELHMSEGTAVANGKTYSCTKLPEYMQNILNQGGLIASLNREEE